MDDRTQNAFCSPKIDTRSERKNTVKHPKIVLKMDSFSDVSLDHDSVETQDIDILSQADIHLFGILQKNYFKTIVDTLKLCLTHDKYLNQLGNIAKMPQAQ